MSQSKSRLIQPEDLLLIKTIPEVHISPDGSLIAYTLTEIDAEQEYLTSIWIVPTEGGEPTQVTRGPKRYTAPRWSPNGTELAFLSDGDGGPVQLYVMPVGGGEARKLTSLETDVGPAVWSPDGKLILFASQVPEDMPPASKMTRARWNRRPKVVTKTQYKNDGQGYTLDTWSHLFIVAAEGGQIKQITDGDWDDFAPAWSPDGRQIAFSRKQNGLTDYNASDIWVVNADGGNPRQISQNVYHATSPSWSPDGTIIAFYGANDKRLGLEESLYRVWTAPVSGGAPQPLTTSYDRGVLLLTRPAVTPGPVWSNDSATVTFSVADQGNIRIVCVLVEEGKVGAVVTGERQVTGFSGASAVGRLAFCAVDPYNPGDIYVCAWDGSEEQRLTWVNESILAHLSMPSVEKHTFRSPNGGVIDGWLMRPVSGEGPMPLLIDIHGGPHGFVGNYFSLSHFYRYTLASKGWAILALNPSGSGSYGEAFANSICGRWGEFDMPEQLAAVDALVAEGIADPNRLAVAGYSYGGYMAAWMISHSDRFRAAVVGAPIVNLESLHGTSDIGMWYCPWEMQGDIISNRDTFRRLSPVNYVEHITTPTLILHGEADERCPIGQGEELFIGLLAVGKVPVEFVRYPESSHLFLSSGWPRHRVDYHRRVMSWLENYVNSSQFEGKQNGE